MTEDSRRGLLERCGFTAVPLEPRGGIWSVREAWSMVIGGNVRPDVQIPYNEPDFHRQVDACWLERASSDALLDEQNEFLISVSGPGSWDLDWARVRWSEDVQMAANLTSPASRHPEFVTMACDGHVLWGVTAEEYSAWLIRRERSGTG